MPESAPTIRRLAELCQVSKSTVAMALRNDPHVAEPTRLRIKAAASREGYVSDPRVNRLMSLLRRQKRNALWNVAWLNSSSHEHNWTQIPWFAGYQRGAERRAAELGYSIDPIWVRSQTPRQLAKVLKARNIQGLLIPFPERPAFWADFPWGHFSSVVVDEFEVKLSLPRVMGDRHGNMRTLLDQLETMGYRRPALWLQRRVDEVSESAYSSAFLGWRYHDRRAKPLLWLFGDLAPEAMRRKIKDHRPDVIICSHSDMAKLLREAGIAVPEDVALTHLNLASDVEGWSGIDQRQETIGSTAMELLNTLLNAGQTGLVDCSQTLSIPGIWKQGTTTLSEGLV